MLTLLLGTDWTKNRDALLNRIAVDVRGGLGNRILLVPELITHDTERRLCQAAGDTASRYAEVLSFSRLALRAADAMGLAAEQCLDNGGRVVAMAASARMLVSRLKAYAAVETKPEFLTDLVDAVDEFKRCCISAPDLMAASVQTQGSLSQKLEELSLLLESYDSLCAQGKRDPRDRMSWILEQMEEASYGRDHVFYIDGFPDFTRQHIAVLEHLIRVSPQVTVSLNCDRPHSSLLAFEKAGQTAAELIRIAERIDVPVQIETVEPARDVFFNVRKNIFQGKLQQQDNLQKCLHLVRTETVWQECVSAAEQVLKLVQHGSRYRDISVVCPDLSQYRPVISMIFHRCGIPVYLSGTEDVLEKSVVNTVLSAMDAAAGDLEQREVLRYLRSVLSPLDHNTCDLVENYVILWGIHGKRWQETWRNHPDGLGEEWTEEARIRLDELDQARQLAMEPLIHLRDGFSKARSLKDQVEALYGFLEDIQLAQRLSLLADELDAAGDNRSAQELNQLWEILLGAMEQIYDVLGNTVWETDSFTRLFKLLLSQYDVGTIPTVLDAVTVGPVSAMRCQEQKHLFVLGAVEGQLPGYGGSAGVLTDQERTALRKIGVPLTGGAMEGLQEEFAEIYGVFCGARETITVSCPGGQPSLVYRRLLDMVGVEQRPGVQVGPALVDPLDAGAWLAARNSIDTARDLGIIQEYHQAAKQASFDMGKVEASHISSLYGKRLRLSASQVDRLAECRMSYFLKYGLRAKERKEASVDPAEFGTYVHAVLEQTAREIRDLGGFHLVSLEKTLEISRKYADAYASERFAQLDSQRLGYLFQRNGLELEMVVRELWQELNAADFEPVDFEVEFSQNAAMPPIEIDGAAMEAELRGFVDRVDRWKGPGGNFFRVVDYKTGRKDFDYCDIFNGVGLQMLLYLFALESGGESILGEHPLPAGVQYFPARVPVMSADGRLTDEEAQKQRLKEWKRRGLLLDDEWVLQAMEPGDNPARLCYATRKDGTRTGDLAGREQLRLLKRYIYRVLATLVNDIASGNVKANPYTRGTSHNACAFCPYGAVCHRDEVENRRNYKAMTAQRFWDEIGKGEKDNG